MQPDLQPASDAFTEKKTEKVIRWSPIVVTNPTGKRGSAALIIFRPGAHDTRRVLDY